MHGHCRPAIRHLGPSRPRGGQLGNPDQANVIHAAGQTIHVPHGNYNVLNLAGAATNGSQTNQKLTLTFTDSSTVTWTQSFSD